jgi:Cu+-exporting ATPase
VSAAAAGFCDHCGLPLGASRSAREEDGRTWRFCCVGCGIAWRFAGKGGREGGSQASSFLARIGLGFVGSMIVMLVAWVPYLEPEAGASPDYRAFAPWATLAVATPVVLVLGVPYLWNAVAGLARGRLGSDLLVGIGIFAAYAASVVSLAAGRPDALYLDTATGLATLVTVGRWLEATAKERAARRLRALLSAAERPAVRLRAAAQAGGRRVEEEVPASGLAVGDLVLVRPGEKVPQDGVVEAGRALLDEAALTGEPLPRAVAAGAAVSAPSIPVDGPLEVRVTAVGEGTRLGAVAAVLARARAERSPVERLADRVSAVFVPGVVVLALAVLARDLRAGAAAAEAGLHALSVLVIACPCALAIATPLAVTAAIGRLAERGILVRSGAALAGLPRVRAVAFDKTGTVTEGRPEVVEVEPAPGVSPDEVLALAAAVEAGSGHALGRGVVAAARARGIAVPASDDVRVVPGRGVGGDVVEAGRRRRVRVGSAAWIGSAAGAASPERATEVFVEADGRPVGRLALADRLRPSAAPAVRGLSERGIAVSILSGDSPAAARAAAASLGLPAEAGRGGLLPADKVEAVARLRAEAGGPVAFVGDGLNDAPALAAADLGIAVGSGTDLARETADVSLLGDDLARIPALLRVARRTRAAVRWNLAWAFAYNAAGLAWAVARPLPPVFAAFAMVASSLSVVLASARLRAALPRDLAAPSPGEEGRLGSVPCPSSPSAST